jgi:NADH-dependent peroxiredoxin subunit C
MSIINTQVQPFKTTAYHNGKFIEVTDQSLKGKWSVLIFMPAAFTFNCPTEVEDAADNYHLFQSLGAEVYIVTTDTHFSHKVWHETSAAVGKARFPLVGDPTHTLTRMFGVHIDAEGLALRGTFVINPMAWSRPRRSMTTASRATSRRRCASCRPRSTSPRTPARSARPSGRKVPRR